MDIILFAALSVDGFIARDEKELSTKWTSKADAEWFGRKTKEVGVCIMGRTTYETIGRPLPKRTSIVLSKSGQPIAELQSIEPTDMGTAFFTSASPEELVAELERRGVTRIALCGGSSVYHQFLDRGMVNRLYLTIEPLLFGTGISLAGKSLTTSLRLVQSHPLSENTVVMEYVVNSAK